MNRLRARTQRRELWRKLNRTLPVDEKAPWVLFTYVHPVSEVGNHSERRRFTARLRRQRNLSAHPRGLQPLPAFTPRELELLEA